MPSVLCSIPRARATSASNGHANWREACRRSSRPCCWWSTRPRRPCRTSCARCPGRRCSSTATSRPRSAKRRDIPHIRAARIPLDAGAAGFDLVEYAKQHAAAQAILVDAHVSGYGGAGLSFDWNAFNWSHPAIAASSRLVLSGGLTPANVTDGILQVRPWAVDVSSGVEAAKGIKDPGKIQRFVAAVRAADALVAQSASLD